MTYVRQEFTGSHSRDDYEVPHDDFEVVRPAGTQGSPQLLYLLWMVVRKLKKKQTAIMILCL